MKNDEVLRLKDERDMTDQEWLDWQKELEDARYPHDQEYYESLKLYSVFWKDVEVNDLYLTNREAHKLARTWREITQCENWSDVEGVRMVKDDGSIVDIKAHMEHWNNYLKKKISHDNNNDSSHNSGE